MKTVDNLIIGAGLSGLSFAYFNKGDYLIVEKNSTPGGYCSTIKNDQYVWDYAGHFYHFKTEKYKKLFESFVEPDQIIRQTKQTFIYYKDQLIDYPFQLNIHQLEKPDFIDCLYDLFINDKTGENTSFLDMLYDRFGKSITEKFLRPYNEKLYATDLTLLDKEAMGRFFPYADREAIIRNMKEQKTATYNDTFMYLKKGTGYFIDKLFAEIDSSKVLFNTSVSNIDVENHIATLSDGQQIQYKNLINSAPLNQFLKLLNSSEYQMNADQLSYNKVLVLNLGFDSPSKKYQKEHWVYFPDKTLNFYRIGFYNNILNQDKLSVYVEIGFSKNAEIDAEKELKEALTGMKKVGIIDDDNQLVDHSTIVMDPAYVHISKKDTELTDQLKQKLAEKNIYNLGRYGSWTYNSMEDCMEMADQLSASMKNA